MIVVSVLVGGFLGAVIRYLVSVALKPYNPTGTFPWIIVFINVLGSFSFGVLQSLSLSNIMASFLLTGILGSFTTFSTFGVEATQLLEKRQFIGFICYVLLSLIGGVLAFWVGYSR